MAEDPTYGQYKPEQEEETLVGLPFKVILFNDDWHTFDEVIAQLVKAVKCSFETARDFAFEVHVKGQAVVFDGMLQECLKVTSVLEEIALNTQIVS
ncbi:MAG: ATP-dependent Clp protease adaptor ClpS [Ignavibacteria bacterium]|jgi:ATP-dependent Clp protease adaptor protein ClpS|nr:ATP-dependent Clp protease adaptor ClpS [Ignavibacteria bacterium]MCU7501458.1 ATP-dependent Clp protease adaptor ClpS [Ignavibacteria bacterium]MCU7516026.1 ATP-dependent Clp protease adaptor ClpS [Ignavibacteria bacterium]